MAGLLGLPLFPPEFPKFPRKIGGLGTVFWVVTKAIFNEQQANQKTPTELCSLGTKVKPGTEGRPQEAHSPVSQGWGPLSVFCASTDSGYVESECSGSYLPLGTQQALCM